MQMSILWTVWLIVLSKLLPCKSYTSTSSNISFFTFLYLSYRGKLLAVEVCTRPHEDALLAFQTDNTERSCFFSFVHWLV